VIVSDYRLITPSYRIHVGKGVTHGALGRELESAGCERVVVVHSMSLGRQKPLLDRIREVVGDRLVGTFTGVLRDCPATAVAGLMNYVMAERADTLVCVGGGSTMTVARAASILLATTSDLVPPGLREAIGDAASHLGMRAMPVSIMIPATPSTAAHGAGAAVLDASRRKFEVYNRESRAHSVLIDPDFLLTAPEPVRRQAAVVTLCAVLETVLRPTLNPVALADLRQAADMLLASLAPRQRATKAQAAVAAAIAAFLAARATSAMGDKGAALALGLAQQVQACYPHIAQAQAVSPLLTPAIEFSQGANTATGATGREFRLFHRLLPVLPRTDTKLWLRSFLAELGLPVRLRDAGVSASDFPAIADAATASAFVRNSPRPVTNQTDLLWILEQAF